MGVELRAAVGATIAPRLVLVTVPLLLLLCVIAVIGRDGEFLLLVFLAFFAGVLGLQRSRPSAKSAVDATLSVDGGALRIARDGAPHRVKRIARDRFREGVVVPESDGSGASLSLVRDTRLRFQAFAPDVAGARALLAELGLSAAHRPHNGARSRVPRERPRHRAFCYREGRSARDDAEAAGVGVGTGAAELSAAASCCRTDQEGSSGAGRGPVW